MPLAQPAFNAQAQSKSSRETGNLNISYDDSDSVASVTPSPLIVNPPKKSLSPKEMKPPARKPYMNRGAIDAHQSEFAVSEIQSDLINTNDSETETNGGLSDI